MTTIAAVNVGALILIWGLIFRYIELRWPDSWVGRALGVIY